MAVITCHFNFAGFKRPQQNLIRFCRQMHTMGIPVYGAEAYMEGREPFTRTWQNWLQIPVNLRQICFQKEALLQRLVQEVPKVHQTLAWIDADIWFGNPKWKQETETMLTVFDVVQMFSMAHWTDIDGTIVDSKKSCVDVGITDKWDGHPGFAWAARRDFLEKIGLFTYGPVGHGDTIMACTFLEQPLLKGTLLGLGRDSPNSHFRRWEAKARPYVTGKVGYVGGDIYHEWHGHRVNRSYYERNRLLQHYVPEEHIRIAENGLLEWTPAAPKDLIKNVASYFPSRKEDG